MTQARTSREPGTLTGWSGDPDYFAFRYYDSFRPEAVLDVLHGRVAGVMFRGMVSAAACAELTARFWASPARRRRGVEAPGFYLGAYHYHKTTAAYLAESVAVATELDAVLAVPGDPLGHFYAGLAGALAAEGARVRRASRGGRLACRALLRSWHGDGEFALAPHEDLAQCGEPKQADFEIQRVARYHVAALNICLENGPGGGLAYWNIQPDEQCKRALGLHYTGSPYPVHSVDGIELQSVDVRPGDVYVFNGAHVHAVRPCTDPTTRRTTLAGILGFVDETDVVTWT